MIRTEINRRSFTTALSMAAALEELQLAAQLNANQELAIQVHASIAIEGPVTEAYLYRDQYQDGSRKYFIVLSGD